MDKLQQDWHDAVTDLKVAARTNHNSVKFGRECKNCAAARTRLLEATRALMIECAARSGGSAWNYMALGKPLTSHCPEIQATELLPDRPTGEG